MKRSRSLSLILMGTLLMGTSCSEAPRDPQDEVFSTFSSVAECTNSGIFDEKECKDLALSALAQNPRFNSLAECEAQFGEGQCNSPTGAGLDARDSLVQNQIPMAENQDGEIVQPQTGSMWMPMMMGFMAGRMMSNRGPMQGSQPLYKDPAAQSGSKSFRTSGGDVVRPDGKGRVSNPSPRLKQSLAHQAKPAVGRTAPKSRGGFKGSSGFGRGFGG